MSARRLAVLVVLLVSLAAGGLLGLAIHGAWMIQAGDANSVSDVVQAAWDKERAAALGAGVLLGLLAGGAACGVIRLGNVLRDLMGVAAGAAAGFVLYALGYVAMTSGNRSGADVFALRFWDTMEGLTVAELAAAMLGSLVGLVVMRHRWRVYGVLAYVAFVSVVAGYFAYVFNVALPRVPPDKLPLSLLLLWAEGMSLATVVVHAFYGLDHFVKRTWRRTPGRVPFSRHYLPRVAFHYACFNEPPEIVFDALGRFKDLDYPPERYVVMVLDDSTDESMRKPVEAFCRANGFMYVHRSDRRGYKAGALNHALALTPRDVELISVIDADYHVEPEYLRETVGYFIDPGLGFLQTPQDYRNVHQSFLTRQYYFADGFFYRAVMPSRNEVNAISFCGTMGMVRRRALEGVGGWAEDHVTEDCELSVRILAGGWRSLFIPKTYGKGLIPPTFDAYKKQHHRWSFGGAKILKAHWRKFAGGRMSFRQRFDFFVSCLQWFDGVYACIIAMAVAAIAAGEVRGEPLAVYHRNEIFLVGLVPVFLLADGLARLHLALRRTMNLGLSGTLKVMGVWYAIKFVHMRAALKAAVGFKVPFVRTPKAPDGRCGRFVSLWRALRLCPFEVSFFLVMASLAVGLVATSEWPVHPAKFLLVVWCVLYALVFLAAPLYAYLSFRTYVTEAELPTLKAGFRLHRPRSRRTVASPAAGR